MILEMVWTLCPLIKILKMSNTWSKSILLQLVSVVCVQTNSLQMEVFCCPNTNSGCVQCFSLGERDKEFCGFQNIQMKQWD